MNRFRNWLVRFMSGRYGSDALGKFTMITYLVLAFAQLFLVRTPLMRGLGGWIWNAVLLLLFAWSVFRMLSRNIVARSRENRRFLSIKNGFKKFFWLRKQMWKDRKTHVQSKNIIGKIGDERSAMVLKRKTSGRSSIFCLRI